MAQKVGLSDNGGYMNEHQTREQLLFELHPNPMLIYDVDTLKIVKVNRAAIEKYGYSKNEFLRLTIRDIRPEESISRLEQALKHLKAEGVNDSGVHVHRSKDGEIFHVEVISQPFPIEHYNSRLVSLYDVTERIETEEKARSAYQELAHHISNSPLAMVKWDSEFRVIEWSDRAERTIGFREEQVLGKTPMDFGFVDYRDANLLLRKMHELKSGEKDQNQLEIRLVNKYDMTIHIKIHSSALRDSEGNMKSVLTLIEDVTKQRKTEIRYQQLFEAANDGICLMKDDKIIDCNKRLAELFEAEKSDIVGSTPYAFSPEFQPDGKPSKERARQEIRKALKGEAHIFEWKHKTMQGKLIDAQVSLNKIDLYDELYIQAIVRDITEMKRIEERVRLRSELFKQLFQNSPIGIIMIGDRDEVIMVNPAFEQMFGYSQDEIEGRIIDDVIVPDHLREEARQINQKTASGLAIKDETVRLRKDGSAIYVLIGSVPVFQEDEKVAVYGMYIDITERKQAEEALKESEQRWESLVSNQPEMVQITRNGEIVYINGAGVKIYGAKSANEIIGKPIFELVDDKYKDEIGKRMQILEQGEPAPVIEHEVVGLDGKKRVVELNSIAITYKGEPAIQTIARDITERKKAEQQIVQSLKEKEILLSEIHHRVKNNLAVISGLVQLQSYNTDDPKVRKLLTESQLRIRSMALIHEKLYQSSNLANIDFKNYIKELVESIKNTLENRHQKISISIEADSISLNVNQAVPTALILNEMITNAYEHAFTNRKKGKLDIKIQKLENSKVRLEVRDDGVGLPASFEELKKESLGMELIESLSRQLEGALNIESDYGTHYILEFIRIASVGSAGNYFV